MYVSHNLLSYSQQPLKSKYQIHINLLATHELALFATTQEPHCSGFLSLYPTSIPAVYLGNLLTVDYLQLNSLSPCFSIKLLKSMRSVTQRPKLFQQCNTVFLQFHNMSKMLQDTWLVAVKTNIQILYYVTGAQEFCCNLKLCNFLITSSAFMQHHCAHIHICSHPWSHSFFHTQHVTKHCIYKTCTNKISFLPFCYIT